MREVVLDGELSLNVQIDGESANVIRVRDFVYPVYEGATEVTPSDTMQTLYTANRTLVTDIVINPIPSNYGLITWNGSTLTVS